MRPHHLLQPRPPEVYRMPITDTSVFRTRSGGPLYKHHSHGSSVALAILLLIKEQTKRKQKNKTSK